MVATPATIERIQNTYEAKLAVWADTLKDGAPDEIVIPEVVEEAIVLGDTTFTIFGDDLEKQTLYNEADDLFLGGILVSTGSHLFMADTKTIESQQQWVKDLEQLEQANPKVVIPAILKIEQVDRNIQSLYKRRTVFCWSSKKSFFLFRYDENSHERFLKNFGKRINEIRDAIQVCNVESHLFCF